MDDITLNRMKLYQGGLGTLETNKGRYIQVRIDEVDDTNQIVKGAQFEMQFTDYDRGKMDAGIQEIGTSFEIPFNEINGFSGKFLEEHTLKQYKKK